MSTKGIEWIVIESHGKAIGAIGFIGHKASVVASFFDDEDGDIDGSVSVGEWLGSKLSPIGIEGMAVTMVAMAARYDLRVIERDASFPRAAAQMFLNFASGLVADGIYAAYFSRGVGTLSKRIVGHIASGAIKKYVIRKGMEKAVKAAYDTAVKY